MKKFICLAISLVLVFSLLAGCASKPTVSNEKAAKDKIIIGIVPEEAPTTVIKNNTGLKNYLSKYLGIDVELEVSTDYSSMMEAMRKGHVDVGMFGPMSYVLLKQKMPDVIPFAAKVSGGSPTYESIFVTNSKSGIETLKDVKGKNVAFSDPASTSVIIWEGKLKDEASLIADKDYKPQFVGGHDAIMKAVQNGNAEAGGTTRPYYEKMVKEGTIDPNKVKILTTTDKVYLPNYPWVMQPGLDPQLQEKIKRAFYDLNDKEVLEALKAEKFVEVKDSDFDGIRAGIKALGIDLEKTQ